MSLLYGIRTDGVEAWWVCDFCRVESVPNVEPLGWIVDEYPGGPHHFCPECVEVHGVEPSTAEDWRAA